MLNLRSVAWLFLRPEGRVGREVYWLGTLFLAFGLGAALSPDIDPETGMLHLRAGGFGMILLLAGFVMNFMVAIKRVHDLGWPGIAAVGVLIPLFSFIFAIVIGLLPGERGPNRFGDAPDTAPRRV